MGDIAVASVGIFGNLLFIFFLSLYMAVDRDRIVSFLFRLVPPAYTDEAKLLEHSVARSFGGFLSMGEKLFAVPWNALTLDTATRSFKLNVDKDRLKTAPGFDKDQWPNMADATWAQSIHAYYGTKLYSDEPRH